MIDPTVDGQIYVFFVKQVFTLLTLAWHRAQTNKLCERLGLLAQAFHCPNVITWLLVQGWCTSDLWKSLVLEMAVNISLWPLKNWERMNLMWAWWPNGKHLGISKQWTFRSVLLVFCTGSDAGDILEILRRYGNYKNILLLDSRQVELSTELIDPACLRCSSKSPRAPPDVKLSGVIYKYQLGRCWVWI